MSRSIKQCLSVFNRYTLSNGFKNNRLLYSEAALGLDNFVRTREKVVAQFANMSDKFKEKMVQYVEPKAANMIFTEDLKNMVHLVESKEEDMDLVVKMMLRFNKQNSGLRFGSFIFGPVVMRMFHHLNQPDKALEVFKNSELDGFFDQIISYQLLMDLLYNHKRYDDVLQVFDIIRNKQIQNQKFPKHVVVLVFATLYQQNTKESFEKALKIWKELNEIGHKPMRRTCTFLAGLALKQNSPHIALEVISGVQKQTYTTVRNLKAAALAALNRPEDALSIIKTILQYDTPAQQKSTFNPDVIEMVAISIKNAANKELAVEFERIHKYLKDNEHLSAKNLDEDLCAEIQATIVNNRNQMNQYSNNQYGDNRRFGREDNFQRREWDQNRRNRPNREERFNRQGLSEMV